MSEEIDLSFLSYGSLIRYKTFFKIHETPNDKNELNKIVNSHFNTMEINNKEVIDGFLRIENDISPNQVNTRKSTRNQEKVDKKV